jgi:AbrB family looped-hinge helix DNA binding protein
MTDRGKCCKVEAIITIDSKGQMVLPKDLRDKAKLKPNDKLAIIGYEDGDEICCFMMIKADKLGDTVKDVLGPMLEELK